MRRRHFLQAAGTAFTPLVFGAGLNSARAAAECGLNTRAWKDPWQPDGWGWLGRLGLLMPHTDIEPDSEFAALAPVGISVHAMRVRWLGVMDSAGGLTRHGPDAARAFVEPPRIDEAAGMLTGMPNARPNAIALCFTSASYVHGPSGDVALKARLETRTGGIPVAITCLAAVSALHTLGVRRVALIHPPWFAEELDHRGADYFQHQGFDVGVPCASTSPKGPREYSTRTALRMGAFECAQRGRGSICRR